MQEESNSRRKHPPSAAGAICLLLPWLLAASGCEAEKPPAPTAPLALSAKGIGGLTAGTPFDREAVATALPDLNVELEEELSEGDAYPVLVASKDGERVLTVTADATGKRIYSVLISSKLINNTLGQPIGTRLDAIYKEAPDCVPLIEEYAGQVLCAAPGEAKIHYQFSGQWAGADGELPPWDVLRTFTLTQIAWLPN